jgi:hypothetical protein
VQINLFGAAQTTFRQTQTGYVTPTPTTDPRWPAYTISPPTYDERWPSTYVCTEWPYDGPFEPDVNRYELDRAKTTAPSSLGSSSGDPYPCAKGSISNQDCSWIAAGERNLLYVRDSAVVACS